MDIKVTLQAIASAEEELKGVEERLAELSPLAARRTTLQQFIANAKSLISDSPVEGQPQPPSVEEPAAKPTDENPIWVGVRDILSKAGRPLSIAEIVKALQDGGWRLSKKWPRETVFAAMKRHSEVFEKPGPGKFTVKKRVDATMGSRTG